MCNKLKSVRNRKTKSVNFQFQLDFVGLILVMYSVAINPFFLRIGPTYNFSLLSCSLWYERATY